MSHPRTGACILVDTLVAQGADLVFGVPDESHLAVLDALRDSPIRFITNRQEGGGAFMADAYGKLTGRPGICFVTRGPGVTNASIGVHTAHQDSTPMILFIGQVGNGHVEREAFQEIDYRRMFGIMTKSAAQIDRADRVPEYVAHIPGRDQRPYRPVQAAPAVAQIAQLHELLAAAKRPLVLLGGAGWNAAGHVRAPLPGPVRQPTSILCRRRRYRHQPETGGYTLLDAPCSRQRLIHIHAAAEELGRVCQADLMINSGMPHRRQWRRSMHASGATRLRKRAPNSICGKASHRYSGTDRRNSICGK